MPGACCHMPCLYGDTLNIPCIDGAKCLIHRICINANYFLCIYVFNCAHRRWRIVTCRVYAYTSYGARCYMPACMATHSTSRTL